MRMLAGDNYTFGGWEFLEVNHDFQNSNFFGSVYFEHDNYEYKHLECWYVRTTIGYKVCDWLKADVAYDFMQEPDYVTHRAIADLTGTLKQGNLKVALRERYMHTWTPSENKQGNVLRSRLKVQCGISETKFTPYLAMEVMTWGGKWNKTRHYAGCTYDVNNHVQMEGYYLYYTFNGAPAEYVVGVGLNLDI